MPLSYAVVYIPDGRLRSPDEDFRGHFRRDESLQSSDLWSRLFDLDKRLHTFHVHGPLWTPQEAFERDDMGLAWLPTNFPAYPQRIYHAREGNLCCFGYAENAFGFAVVFPPVRVAPDGFPAAEEAAIQQAVHCAHQIRQIP